MGEVEGEEEGRRREAREGGWDGEEEEEGKEEEGKEEEQFLHEGIRRHLALLDETLSRVRSRLRALVLLHLSQSIAC